MKNIRNVLILSTFVALLILNYNIGISFDVNNSDNSISLASIQVANAQDSEGYTGTCSSGNSGQCFTLEQDVQFFGLVVYCYCDFTGRPADNCSSVGVAICNGDIL